MISHWVSLRASTASDSGMSVHALLASSHMVAMEFVSLTANIPNSAKDRTCKRRRERDKHTQERTMRMRKQQQ